MSEFRKKLGAMILLLAEKRKVTRTELNKLLFFTDVVHYLRCNRTISGEDYYKRQFGPVPDGVDFTRNTLVGWKFLTEQTRMMSLYYQYDYQTRDDRVEIGSVQAELAESERAAVEDVNRCLAGYSATALSNLTHNFEPWKSSMPESRMNMTLITTDGALRAWLTDKGIALP